MKPLFADTFFFLDLLNASDSAHLAATEITEALTGDRHFEQAEFTILLK